MEQLQADVLVVGGGPAGIGAALASARRGAKTLLLERHGFLGGVASFGLGMPMNQMRPFERPRSAIHEMVIDRLRSYGPDAVSVVDHAVVTNVEYLKVAVIDVLESVRCDFRVHCPVVDAVMEGARVVGAVISTKQGLAKVRAKAVVDASGDADLAHFAGVTTLKGRENDGFLSPMTLCLMVTNIDTAKARQFVADGGMKRLLEQARPKYPLLPASMHFELGPFPIHNSLVINHSGTRLYGVLDGTSTDHITTAETYSRRQVLQIVAALREFGGAVFANVQIASAGPQIGVRETRRIKGQYVLTEEDAKTGARFDDAIAWRSGFLDIGFVRYEKMKVHDVPYRALLPEKIDGLLASGRCMSATHVGAAAGKSMGNCMATGHAAGLAAALCSQRNCLPGDLNVKDLQSALSADGVKLR
jgi:hypothetical protein